MAEGSVSSVWHKSFANLPSIAVDTLSFVSSPQETDENAVLSLYSSLYRQSFVQNTTEQFAMIVCWECLVFILLPPQVVLS